MRRLILLLLCAVSLSFHAQHITRQYRNVSMADALRELNTLQHQYIVNFIYDELEDFRVTTTVRGLSVPDAIRQLIGFYPIRMTQQDDVLLVECTHKVTLKYTGRVVDRQGNAIEFANVALLHPDTQALIAGGVTNADGMFVIPCDAPSALLRITYVGYKTVNQRVGNPRVGTIRMDEDHITLKGVNVTEIRPTVTYKADRYVVNIRGSILGKGNTAESLLTQLPGVWVNGSSISINGIGGTQVMVNDRSVNLTGDQLINYLKTIRSEEIENIEIISNPPAEFAAEGKGGYLRIITRQRQSGSSLTVGTDLDLINYNALEPNVSYSYNKGKFGFDASANGTLGKGYLRSDELTRNSETHTDYDNRITDRMDDAILSVNTNLYYDFNPRNKWVLNLNYYSLNKDEHINGTTDITAQPPVDITRTLTWHQTLQHANHYGASLNYTHLFGHNDRHKLLVLADYIGSSSPTKDYHTYDNYDATGQTISVENTYNINKSPFAILSAEARVQWDMEQRGTMTLGAKASHSVKNNDYAAHTLRQDAWQLLPEQGYNLRYKEDLEAGYIKYELDKKTWNLSAGIRAEYNRATAEGFDFAYHHFDVFPNFYYSLHPNDRHQLTLSLSRRTQRVRFFQMMPYHYFYSRYTLQEGNPRLRPDYSYHANLTYMLHKKYNLSVNYVWSNNGIESYNRTTVIDGRPLTTSTYVDGVKARYLNINAYIPIRVSARWSMTNQVRLNSTHFETSETRLNGFGWNLYTQQTLILPWDLRFQLLYRYNSKTKTAYGEEGAYHLLNTSWMKSIGDHLTLKLAITDWIWAQKPKTIVNNGAIYKASNMYGRQIPSFSLSISYTISKGKQLRHDDIEHSNNDEKRRAL